MRVLNVTKDSPEILFGCCTIAFPALSSVSNILRMTDVNKRKSSMKILAGFLLAHTISWEAGIIIASIDGRTHVSH